MLVSIRLVLHLIFPLLLGVLAALLLSHFALHSELSKWYDESEVWLKENQRKQIQSLAFANKEIIEENLRQKDFDTGQCDPSFYELFDREPLYTHKWFSRYANKFEELPAQDQDQLYKTINSLVYGKTALKTRKNSLLSISMMLQFFDTSLSTGVPGTRPKFQDTAYKEICIDDKGNYNFDARCHGWYILAMSSERIEIFEPFVSSQAKEILSVEVKKITNELSPSQMVLFLNIGFSNFMKKILQIQDDSQRDLSIEGYNVLLHASKKSLIFHRSLDPTSGVKVTWGNAEFPTSSDDQDINEKEMFVSRANDLIEKCKVQQVSSLNNQTDNFSFEFTKKGVPYVATLLPVELISVNSQSNGKKPTISTQNPMIIGRVERDFHLEILESSLQFNNIHLHLSISGFVFVGVILFVAGLHLVAVLHRSIDIPMDLLCSFLIWQDFNLQELQEQHSHNHNFQRHNYHQAQDDEIDNSHPQLNSQKRVFSRFNPMNQHSQQQQQTSKQLIRHNQEIQPQQAKQQGSILQSSIRLGQEQLLSKKQSDIRLGMSAVNSDENLVLYYNNNRESKNKFERAESVIPSSSEPESPTASAAAALPLISQGNRVIKPIRIHLNSRSNSHTNYDTQVHSSQMQRIETPVDSPFVELQDIQSGFEEMNVIIRVFQKMENVIKLAKSSDVTGDSDNSLLCYSKLASMMEISNNLQGMSNCQARIGGILMKKSAFLEAARSLELAVKLTLKACFDIDSINEFEILIQAGSVPHTQFASISRVIYRLKLLSLSELLLGRKTSQSSIKSQQQNAWLYSAKHHVQLAISLSDKCFEKESSEMGILSILEAEIEIELENYQRASSILSELPFPFRDSRNDWIASYAGFLKCRVQIENKGVRGISVRETIIQLAQIIEECKLFDGYLVRRSLELIYEGSSSLNSNIIREIEFEMEMFQAEREFEFIFIMNSSEKNEIQMRYTNIIREIVKEFCENRDTYQFYKFGSEGITEFEIAMINSKEHFENCLNECIQGNIPNNSDGLKESNHSSSLIDVLEAILCKIQSDRASDGVIINYNDIPGQIRGGYLIQKRRERILLVFDSQEYDLIQIQQINEIEKQGQLRILHVSVPMHQFEWKVKVHEDIDLKVKKFPKNNSNHSEHLFQSAEVILQFLARMRQKRLEFSRMFLS